MKGKARLAWELYLKMETSGESFSLLQLIANDAYKMGQFYYAAKAFDMLERLDPNPEYWEGKRGACVGVFQAVMGEVKIMRSGWRFTFPCCYCIKRVGGGAKQTAAREKV
jgi:hypothetical protein